MVDGLARTSREVDIVTTTRSPSARPRHPATPLCSAIDITTTPWRPFATLLCLCLFLLNCRRFVSPRLTLFLLPLFNFPFFQRYPIHPTPEYQLFSRAAKCPDTHQHQLSQTAPDQHKSLQHVSVHRAPDAGNWQVQAAHWPVSLTPRGMRVTPRISICSSHVTSLPGSSTTSGSRASTSRSSRSSTHQPRRSSAPSTRVPRRMSISRSPPPGRPSRAHGGKQLPSSGVSTC